jgi:hypothetical protein
VATTDTRASDTLPRLPSSDDQADIDAAFSAITAGDGAHSARRLSDENPGHGRLTVTGADAATIEQFTRLRPRQALAGTAETGDADGDVAKRRHRRRGGGAQT